SQVRQRATGEHVQEHPFVGVVGATDLPRLDPSDVPRVTADPLTDLHRGASNRRGELARRALSAQLPEGEVRPRWPGVLGRGHGRALSCEPSNHAGFGMTCPRDDSWFPESGGARTYPSRESGHARFSYKPDISYAICHELPSFAAVLCPLP